MRGSAPGERRGGRQKGTPNRKTAVLREMLAEEKADPARSLIRIARKAEERDELDLAADCWGKLATFAYPRPRPVEIDPDALVELEHRRAAARVKAGEVQNPLNDLAERLRRAQERRKEMQAELERREAEKRQRLREEVRAELLAELGQGGAISGEASPSDPPRSDQVTPAPEKAATAESRPDNAASKRPDYQPILPPFPERQAFVANDYEPL